MADKLPIDCKSSVDQRCTACVCVDHIFTVGMLLLPSKHYFPFGTAPNVCLDIAHTHAVEGLQHVLQQYGLEVRPRGE